MKPYMCRRRQAPILLCLMVLLVGSAVTRKATAANQAVSWQVTETKFHPADAATRAGFECFYNLEYDQAIRDFEQALKQHADDPSAVNHLLSAVMFKELYRIGALDTELYAKNNFLTSKQFPIDPQAEKRIKALMEQALKLSQARLDRNSDDVDALYARGVTRGLRATYIGLIQKAWFAALRSAVGARRDHERVLQLSPGYTDAKTIVGVHNYVMGSLSFAMKAAVSIVGLGGSKTKGLQYLEDAANAGGETSVDAKMALSMFLRREQRYPEALALVAGLVKDHPRNFLFALEQANLLNAAGRGPDAIAAYRNLLDGDKQGLYPEAHIEMVSYGLGEALRGQRQYKEAAAAYDLAMESKKADPEMKQKASLAAGEMYDLLSERRIAVERYELALNGNPERAQLAKKLLKQPYKIEN